MDTKENKGPQGRDMGDSTTNPTEQHSSVPNDLPDSKHDRDRLQPEEATIDLPDVEDIPGQENVTVPPLGEMADVTISSDDEEGKDIFEQDTDGIGIQTGRKSRGSNSNDNVIEGTP